jgi:hypothetical protein
VTDSDVASASSEIAQVDTYIETVRACVACGYNLFGLGDEPRCPECGLRNIPDEFRRQVWELVDSGKWFFSGPLALFRKRPPGWWWALDRPGDLRRSLKAVARNAVIAAAILFAGTAIGSSIAVETTMTFRVWNLDDPTGAIIYQTSRITRDGLVRSGWETVKEPDFAPVFQQTHTFGTSTASRVVAIPPDKMVLPVALSMALWLALTWVGPVFVGLVTQIRKGLPEFARPPLTIVAAGAYESHRLIWASAASAFALIIAAFAFARAVPSAFRFLPADLLLIAIPVVAVLFPAIGWVAPLRTDYTKQLIRSRGHAARIVVMYALLFPVLTTWALVMLVLVLFFLNR